MGSSLKNFPQLSLPISQGIHANSHDYLLILHRNFHRQKFTSKQPTFPTATAKERKVKNKNSKLIIAKFAGPLDGLSFCAMRRNIISKSRAHHRPSTMAASCLASVLLIKFNQRGPAVNSSVLLLGHTFGFRPVMRKFHKVLCFSRWYSGIFEDKNGQ